MLEAPRQQIAHQGSTGGQRHPLALKVSIAAEALHQQRIQQISGRQLLVGIQQVHQPLELLRQQGERVVAVDRVPQAAGGVQCDQFEESLQAHHQDGHLGPCRDLEEAFGDRGREAVNAERDNGFAADGVIAQMVGAFEGDAGDGTGSGPQHRDDLVGAELQHGDVAAALQRHGAQQRPPADLGHLPVNAESLDDVDQFACGAKAESLLWIHLLRLSALDFIHSLRNGLMRVMEVSSALCQDQGKG